MPKNTSQSIHRIARKIDIENLQITRLFLLPMEVEQREILGGWLFGLIPEWTNTTFHQVQGFYLPDSIQKAFISYLIPFYLGKGVAK